MSDGTANVALAAHVISRSLPIAVTSPLPPVRKYRSCSSNRYCLFGCGWRRFCHDGVTMRYGIVLLLL